MYRCGERRSGPSCTRNFQASSNFRALRSLFVENLARLPGEDHGNPLRGARKDDDEKTDSVPVINASSTNPVSFIEDGRVGAELCEADPFVGLFPCRLEGVSASSVVKGQGAESAGGGKSNHL